VNFDYLVASGMHNLEIELMTCTPMVFISITLNVDICKKIMS